MIRPEELIYSLAFLTLLFCYCFLAVNDYERKKADKISLETTCERMVYMGMLGTVYDDEELQCFKVNKGGY